MMELGHSTHSRRLLELVYRFSQTLSPTLREDVHCEHTWPHLGSGKVQMVQVTTIHRWLGADIEMDTQEEGRKAFSDMSCTSC